MEKKITDYEDPFGPTDDGYDLNKETNVYAFPGRMWALIGNTEQEIPTPGMTKREHYSSLFMASLSAEFVKKPLPAIIEAMASTSVKMADALISELNKTPTL